MNEHNAARLRRGNIEYWPDSGVMHGITLHGWKEAHPAQALSSETRFDSGRCIWRDRVHHEVSVKTPGQVGDGGCNGILVAWNTCYERSFGNVMAIKLVRPGFGEALVLGKGHLPTERVPDIGDGFALTFLSRERSKKAMRKKVDVGVLNGDLAPWRVHHSIMHRGGPARRSDKIPSMTTSRRTLLTAAGVASYNRIIGANDSVQVGFTASSGVNTATISGISVTWTWRLCARSTSRVSNRASRPAADRRSRTEIFERCSTARSSRPLFDLHVRNFLDCIKSRRRPIADVEGGHQVTTASHPANISLRAGRELKWDPEREEIQGDPEANAMLVRPYRKPWDDVSRSLNL